MKFEITKSSMSFKQKLCLILVLTLTLTCLHPCFSALSAYSYENVSTFNVTSGNVTGGNVTGGNVTNGNVGGVYLKISDDYNSFYVAGASKYAYNIKIPSTYNGLPVTTIASKAFYEHKNISSITIPNSVTSIGYGAFSGCINLASVTIPNSVTNINSSVFFNCTNLSSITLPNSITSIGSYAFYNCRNLTSITVPESVTSIGNYAFYDCKNLAYITIPDSVTNIGNSAFYNTSHYHNSSNWENGVLYIGNHLIKAMNSVQQSYAIRENTKTIAANAFYNCYRLTSVIIPEGVKSIGDDAFNWCYNLTSITIPESVTNIGDSAFYYCYRITSITLPDSVTSIGRDAFTGTAVYDYGDWENSALLYIGNHLIKANSAVDWYCSIKENTKTIADYAFSECQNIPYIEIPNSVTTIGDYAFQNCQSLQFINLPDSVTVIGEYAFDSCGNLYGVVLPNGLTTIGKGIFNSCESLCDVTIPESVTSIGDYAFANCKNLEFIAFPENLTSIGKRAFSYCEKLESVTIPDSVTTIKDYAFYKCTRIESIKIPENITSIAKGTFGSCKNLKSIKFTENIASIGAFSFANCSKLGSITIPDSVTSIGKKAFYRCGNLISVVVPENITILSALAFAECTKLRTVSLPENLLCIDYSAFKSCASLASFTIPNTVKTLGNAVFNNCTLLKKIFVPDSVVCVGKAVFNPNTVIYGYSDTYIEEYAYNNVLDFVVVSGYCNSATYTPITKNKIEFTCYIGDSSEVSIPSKIDNYSVYSIAAYAFEGNSHVRSIIVPETLVKVDEHAFENCRSLKSVTLAYGVKTIGAYAFADCRKLTKVVLPLTVKKLEAYTFKNCQSLTSIVIPESVTEIDLYAFYNCVNLNTIYGQPGSYAEEFAEENGYEFVDAAESIVNIAAAPIKVIEDTKGYFTTDNNGEEFFYYDLSSLLECVDFTITYGSGETTTVDYWELQSLIGDSIEEVTDQYKVPFVLGNNELELKVGSYSIYVPFEIIENPVESIEISEISIIEETNGYYAYDYDENGNEIKFYLYSFYEVPFTATLKDGTVLNSTSYGSVNIYGFDYYISTYSEQSGEKQWNVGAHVAVGNLLGVEDEFSVIITESPIESINCQDISITEFTNGYYSYHYEDDVEIEYFRYDAPIDCVITLKNGTVVQCDENGRYEYNGEYYYLEIEDTQSGVSPWIKDNFYPVTACAMGASDTFNVTITETNIKSIEVSVVNPFYSELTNDSLYANEYVLNIKYKDGTTETLNYSCADLYENDVDLFTANDLGNNWDIGSHKGILRYQGYIAEFDYQVIKNPYEKIEISNDNGLTIMLYNTNDTFVEAIPYGFDARLGDMGYEEGHLYTDEGIYWARINYDSDMCSNIKLTIGEMESNVLPKNNWYKALHFSQRFSSIVDNCCPTLHNYNGTITARNIDDIVASCYIYLRFPVKTVDSDFYCILAGENVRKGIAEIYGIENVDLSLSSMYDDETDTIKIPGYGFGEGPSKEKIQYSNNTWTYIKSHSWSGEDVEIKLELNDNLKVKTIHFSNILFDVVDNEKTTIDREKDIIFTETLLSETVDDLILLDDGVSTKINYSFDLSTTKLIGTGSVIEFYDSSNKLVDSYTVVVTGDLNGDGVVDVLDASLCSLYANELRTPTVIEAYAANGRTDNTIDIVSYQNVVNLCLS